MHAVLFAPFIMFFCYKMELKRPVLHKGTEGTGAAKDVPSFAPQVAWLMQLSMCIFNSLNRQDLDGWVGVVKRNRPMHA